MSILSEIRHGLVLDIPFDRGYDIAAQLGMKKPSYGLRSIKTHRGLEKASKSNPYEKDILYGHLYGCRVTAIVSSVDPPNMTHIQLRANILRQHLITLGLGFVVSDVLWNVSLESSAIYAVLTILVIMLVRLHAKYRIYGFIKSIHNTDVEFKNKNRTVYEQLTTVNDQSAFDVTQKMTTIRPTANSPQKRAKSQQGTSYRFQTYQKMENVYYFTVQWRTPRRTLAPLNFFDNNFDLHAVDYFDLDTVTYGYVSHDIALDRTYIYFRKQAFTNFVPYLLVTLYLGAVSLIGFGSIPALILAILIGTIGAGTTAGRLLQSIMVRKDFQHRVKALFDKSDTKTRKKSKSHPLQ